MPTNTPAGTADYVYPAIIEEREQAAIEKADQEATQGGVTNPIVRDTIPSIDFDVGSGDVEIVTGGEWEVAINADGTGTISAGDQVEVYEIDSDTGNADDRATVVYGFEAVNNADLVDKVLFNASDGQTFERAVVAGLDSTGNNPADAQKILRSPVSFGPQENATIEFVLNEDVDATTQNIELKMLAVTAEKQGRQLGTRNQ